ncbi:MAG: N-acetylmuramate alpha-1-phosphate uridylyltransferase MurU [Thiolinea sp.]
MKAMILAAGHGTRMRPLTNHTPKPLLTVAGKPLIVWHIEKLAAAGYRDIVINIGWLGDQIPDALGTGTQWNVNLLYSDEQEEGVLETAGGIVKALSLLGDEPFLVISADVWCDFPCLPYQLAKGDLVHLILVSNPEHHPGGDFALQANRILTEGDNFYTYSGIGYYHPDLFHKLKYGKRPLAPLLREAMQNNRVSGEYYSGDWQDIGTPERLASLNQQRL